MHEQNLAIIKGLVAVSWADGHVAAQEAEVLEGLLEAFGASPSERIELKHFAAERRTLDDVPLTDLSWEDRRFLFLQSVLVTLADGVQQEAERQLLEQLRMRLRIEQPEAMSLSRQAEAQAAGMAGLR
jgi:prepilin-type processing-associated H-X9-DG protein